MNLGFLITKVCSFLATYIEETVRTLSSPHRGSLWPLWSWNARHKPLEIKGQVAQWMEGEALVRLWPGSRLLAWGFRQALLRASSVTCLHPWAQCEGRLFFLKFLVEMEIGGGRGSERGAEEPWPRRWSSVPKVLSFSFFTWVWRENEANSFLFLSVLYQYSSQFSIWNINESAMSNLFLLCCPFKPLASAWWEDVQESSTCVGAIGIATHWPQRDSEVVFSGDLNNI